MYIGGYSDWTPAEQREWDRDWKEENERLLEERKNQQEKELKAIKAETKTWKEWALFNPLYKAFLIGDDGPLTLTVYLHKNSPVRTDVDCNMLFEMGYPMFLELTKTLRRKFPKKTSEIKLQVSSRQDKTREFTRYCTPKTWSFTVMEDILEGLRIQSPQDFTEGLIIKPSFIIKVD